MLEDALLGHPYAGLNVYTEINHANVMIQYFDIMHYCLHIYMLHNYDKESKIVSF